MNLKDCNWERWNRLLPVREVKFIEGDFVFRDYSSVWGLLEQVVPVTDFAIERRVFLRQGDLLKLLCSCLEFGRMHGADDLDMERVRELTEVVTHLDPDILIDVENLLGGFSFLA